MKHEEHYDNCYKALGEGFPDVHKWLDELAYITYPEVAHRCFRHHWAGIAEAEIRWGKMGAEAAKIHILDDLEWMGYARWESNIPKDREDAKRFFGNIDDFIEGD